jgi:hypothetical protein
MERHGPHFAANNHNKEKYLFGTSHGIDAPPGEALHHLPILIRSF